jgi:hypothetical protein
MLKGIAAQNGADAVSKRLTQFGCTQPERVSARNDIGLV